MVKGGAGEMKRRGKRWNTMKKLLQAGRDDDNDGDDARLSVWLNRVKKKSQGCV